MTGTTCPPPRHAEEGGKLYLAERLFHLFPHKIRCPQCKGDPLKPGFIKDQAGKGDKNRVSRRQWSCQRSNARNAVLPKCSRVTCTDFIALARKQLQSDDFDHAVRETYIQRCEYGDYPDLRAYWELLSGDQRSVRPRMRYIYITTDISRTPVAQILCRACLCNLRVVLRH